MLRLKTGNRFVATFSIYVFLFFIFPCHYGLAQSSFVSAGGEAGNTSYSIGLVAFTHLPGALTSVTQGVQHAYLVETKVDEVPDFVVPSNIEVRFYPNPTRDVVTLQIKNFNLLDDELYYRVFSVAGFYSGSNKLIQSETQINLSLYPAGIFFLNLFTGTKSIGIFKIVKI
jgi:hypothetical protein